MNKETGRIRRRFDRNVGKYITVDSYAFSNAMNLKTKDALCK